MKRGKRAAHNFAYIQYAWLSFDRWVLNATNLHTIAQIAAVIYAPNHMTNDMKCISAFVAGVNHTHFFSSCIRSIGCCQGIDYYRMQIRSVCDFDSAD